LNAKTREKVYLVAGPEFGEELCGRILVVEKAIYGLLSSAARFHECLSDKIRSLGFSPSKVDSDLWMKNKGDHYEFIATYVDDVLIWSKDPVAIMKELQNTFTMKGVGVPEFYLGGDIERLDEHWSKEGIDIALSAKTYIGNVIPKFEALV